MNRGPMFKYDEQGNKIQFQRLPRNMNYDPNGSWRLVPFAYNKNEGNLHWLLSDDQKEVIGLLGQPDYIRRPFYSLTKEKVHEWAYWEKSVLVQFINREMVYLGPLKDREKLLIRYGYPRYHTYDPLESGMREVFIYSNDLEQRRSLFNFHNGHMVPNSYLGVGN
jgi:hypothetical protein